MDMTNLESLLHGSTGIGTIAVALVAGVVMSLRAITQANANDDPEVAIANDRLIDRRRTWVQGVGFILMRLHDNAYLPDDLIRSMLQQSYGLDDRAGFDALIADLSSREKDAWNLLRAMLVLRSGVAVGWLTNEASYLRCFAIGEDLQQTYGSWEELADTLLRQRRAWRHLPLDGSEDDESMLEVRAAIRELSRTIWRQTPWDLPLDQA